VGGIQKDRNSNKQNLAVGGTNSPRNIDRASQGTKSKSMAFLIICAAAQEEEEEKEEGEEGSPKSGCKGWRLGWMVGTLIELVETFRF
jgi:hypothetical protein